MPAIPITWEAKKDFGVRTALTKSVRLFLKNNLKQNRLEAWLRWYSTCLARVRS
jgi:hypothetical protein